MHAETEEPTEEPSEEVDQVIATEASLISFIRSDGTVPTHVQSK